MSRSIHFRAWDIFEEKMKLVKSINYANDGYAKTIRVQLVDSAGDYVHGESCILVEWTGLVDKNESPIYEGDILKLIFQDCEGDYHEVLSEIKWEKFRWALNPNRGNICVALDNEEGALSIEVIGNIYENEELLDKEESL